MRFAYTSLFKRSFAKLTEETQRQVDDAIRLFAQRPFHPFPKRLAVHKLAGVTGTPASPDHAPPPVWEMHATRSIIITFQ